MKTIGAIAGVTADHPVGALARRLVVAGAAAGAGLAPLRWRIIIVENLERRG